MIVSARYILAALAVLAPGVAAADCCGGHGGERPVVAPPPPPTKCAAGCGGQVFTPRVTVTPPNIVVPSIHVGTPNIVVNHASVGVVVGASAFARSEASASAGVVFLGGGGFGGGVFDAPAAIGGEAIMLTAATETVREARRVQSLTGIQAICMDDRDTPHPASQTFGEKTVPDSYRGEIYRCMAGTKMRVSLGEEKILETFDCAKSEALVYDGARVTCAPQEPKRPCNERSLLRRYGPGAKVARLERTEMVESTVRREEARTAATGGHMVMDGGVGVSVW